MSSRSPLIPIFNSWKNSKKYTSEEYLVQHTDLLAFIRSSSIPTNILKVEFSMAFEFLNSHCRRSEPTYNSYRNEVEKLLTWAWCVKEKPLGQLSAKAEWQEFFDFLISPPTKYIGYGVRRRFREVDGYFISNPDWKIFAHSASKSEMSKARQKIEGKSDKEGNPLTIGVSDVSNNVYTPSQSSLRSSFTILNVFCTELLGAGLIKANFVPAIKKRCEYLDAGTGPDTVDDKILSELQWDYVLSVAKERVIEDPHHIRTVFLVASLKSLYLRISEYSVRDAYVPTMSDFYEDYEGNWWVKIYGKGKKHREVSVPDSFLPYLKTYRKYLGLSGLPTPDDKHVIIGKKNAPNEPVTVRQLRRIVQVAFDDSVNQLIEDGFTNDAEKLRSATTHWLRHTGASQDVHIRPLRHLSEDLGHGSISTTDRIYLHAEKNARAFSGKNRKI